MYCFPFSTESALLHYSLFYFFFVPFYYFRGSTNLNFLLNSQTLHFQGSPNHIAFYLILALLFSSTPLFSLLLFFSSCLFLSFFTSTFSYLLSLLSLLVYLGALIVLFAYLWIFVSYSSRAPYSYSLCLVLISLFLSSVPCPCSISSYLFATAFLLYLVFLLFWAMLVVVHILDLSLGGFST